MDGVSAAAVAARRARAHPHLPPFESLLEAHSELVLRFLSRRLPSAEAEDCFQETFLAALAAYPSLRDAGNLRAWLLTIARNKVADVRRASARAPQPLPEDDLHAAAMAPDPADADTELWDAVKELPAKQRRAVALRYAADRTYDDIAHDMSTTPEAARRNVHEGIKKLRRAST